ncbi:restriction endonuclease subunit S [Vibrio celticus]|uniref:restriction endonuclease subunit S n=1 Tax=Vibrio celticus TaxID=446372 RepID=UPI0040676BDF
MGSDWKNIPLGNLITLQRGHDLPSQDRTEGCVPIMGSSGLTGWHNEAKMTGPGVVVGRSGNSMGLVSYSDSDFWPLNTCLYVTDFKGNDVRYIYYLLQQIEFDQFNSGSAQKSLNRNAVYPFEVYSTEDKDEQRAIAKLLSDFEEKIALNNQINQTLEQMAQTLFKSWFVDFDPVKAKMNGEHPKGMDVTTASLFPEKLVESELGLIPEGWEPKQLKEVLELAYGKALKKTDRVAGDVPVYGSGALTGYHNQSLIEGPGIIVGRKGTVGSVYWEPKAFYPIDTVFYVKPKTGYSLKYCHLVLQNLGLKDMNTDAAVPGLNRNNAYRLDVITPSEPVLKKFEEMMQSFQSKVDTNNAQNASLESLRDTLLPKLLSGEIDLENVQVKEVKAIVE